MSAHGLLASYRLAFAAILLVASVLTIAGPEHDAVALAAAEIAGIAFFVWRRSQHLGAAILLGVFAFAESVSISRGQLPTHFLQYAAAVIFVIAMDRRLAQRG